MGAVHGVHLPWHDHAFAETTSSGPVVTYHHWIKAIKTVFAEKTQEVVNPEYMSDPHRGSTDCGCFGYPDDPDPPKPLGWVGKLPSRTLIYHRFDDADSDETCQAGGDHRPMDVLDNTANYWEMPSHPTKFNENGVPETPVVRNSQ
jgi:hypothetical protein